MICCRFVEWVNNKAKQITGEIINAVSVSMQHLTSCIGLCYAGIQLNFVPIGIFIDTTFDLMYTLHLKGEVCQFA